MQLCRCTIAPNFENIDPSFPASSPWVLAVGGTQGTEYNKPEESASCDIGEAFLAIALFNTVNVYNSRDYHWWRVFGLLAQCFLSGENYW